MLGGLTCPETISPVLNANFLICVALTYESFEVSEKFPVPIYDTNYVDYITFFSNKPLSKSYVDKLLESCKILFNAEEVVKAKIFKTN